MSFLSSVLRIGFDPYPNVDPKVRSAGSAWASAPKTGATNGATKTSGARVSGDQEYVIDRIGALAESRKGDRSTASLKAMLLDYDSGGKGCLNKDDVTRILNDAGVCVKKMGICMPNGIVAGKIIDAIDTTGDRCISWDEYKIAAGVTEDTGPAKPPPPPADPDVISDDDRNAAAVTDEWIAATCPSWAAFGGTAGPELCRQAFEQRRTEARAKIARIEGSHPEDLMVSTMVPGALLFGDALTTTDAAHRAAPGPAHPVPVASAGGLSTKWKIGLAIAIPTGLYLLFRPKSHAP